MRVNLGDAYCASFLGWTGRTEQVPYAYCALVSILVRCRWAVILRLFQSNLLPAPNQPLIDQLVGLPWLTDIWLRRTWHEYLQAIRV